MILDVNVGRYKSAIICTIINKTFEKVGDISDGDVVLFTTRLKDFNPKLYLNCNNAIVQYLCKNGYQKVILKRHPRDYTPYKFNDSILVKEIEPYIAAEDIISLADKQDMIFMYPSATMLGIHDITKKIYILKFSVLFNTKLYVQGYEKALDAVKNAGVDFTEIIL